MYVTKECLKAAVQRTYGTAGHLLKIWFVLKHMGLTPEGAGVEIDTSNSTPSLKILFDCGDPDGQFFVPFAPTPRFLTMKHDAARSIIQTTIRRWATSGSVVTCDPTDFLSISENGKLIAATGRRYPLGLGIGSGGFALDDDSRVSLPLTSFAVWYGRKTKIPPDVNAEEFLVQKMLDELNLSHPEQAAIFVDDDLDVETASNPLNDADVYDVCLPFIKGKRNVTTQVHQETFKSYSRRIRSMVSDLDLPAWMRTSPAEELQGLIDAGATAILLFGPPRTGKTRFIDQLVARNNPRRCTIQIHDGWGYDHLIEGFKPDIAGEWGWVDGPLKSAIENGKKFVVLEEINRTSASQALGEVFSLLEDAYRGPTNAITLRSGKTLWIPEDCIIIMTMNTVDKSTEEVDDALMGRVCALEFPPRPEDLSEMLVANGVSQNMTDDISNIYAEIIESYPLGHGYFSGLKGDIKSLDFIKYYKSRIRPVLKNHFGDLRKVEIDKIDNLVDEKFG
ncbi:AAA family ATPase [Acetobacter fabarum]|uniref:AAA family ATPase n=1 Tax=Acetobacter fabarum TaxID=483199 RepID=UPI0039EBC055